MIVLVPLLGIKSHVYCTMYSNIEIIYIEKQVPASSVTMCGAEMRLWGPDVMVNPDPSSKLKFITAKL